MSDLERNAWQPVRMIAEGFLGKHQRDDYAMLVSNLIKSYEKAWLLHVLKAAFFPFSLGFLSRQLGKRK